MENKQLVDVITQALEIANKAGVYNLKDSAIIFTALTEITQKLVPEVEVVENPEIL
jgi:hypothetical protein